MGLISKRIHQKATLQTIQPLAMVSTLSPDEVYRAVDKLVKGYVRETGSDAFWNSTGYEYIVTCLEDGARHIVCQRPLGRLRPMVGWEATLRARPHERGSSVRFAVSRYKTSDGNLILAKGYREFREHLLGALATTPQTEEDPIEPTDDL